MKIQVNGKYFFESNSKLKVGDRVLLPSSPGKQDKDGPTWIGNVTGVNMEHDAVCCEILEVLKRS